MASDDHDVCDCGHDRAVHEHYRRGSDCGVCGADVCAEFRVDPEATTTLSPTRLQPHAGTA